MRRRPGNWARRAILIGDRVSRWWRGIGRPETSLGPVFSVEVRKLHRTVQLEDGSLIERGQVVGLIHLDNTRVWDRYDTAESRVRCYYEVRRLMAEALGSLSGGNDEAVRFAPVRAFSATTVFHRSLHRFGFRREHGAPVAHLDTLGCEWLRAMKTGYSGRARCPAARVWITREELMRRYGAKE